jgi:hypothetical protein
MDDTIRRIAEELDADEDLQKSIQTIDALVSTRFGGLDTESKAELIKAVLERRQQRTRVSERANVQKNQPGISRDTHPENSAQVAADGRKAAVSMEHQIVSQTPAQAEAVQVSEQANVQKEQPSDGWDWPDTGDTGVTGGAHPGETDQIGTQEPEIPAKPTNVITRVVSPRELALKYPGLALTAEQRKMFDIALQGKKNIKAKLVQWQGGNITIDSMEITE